MHNTTDKIKLESQLGPRYVEALKQIEQAVLLDQNIDSLAFAMDPAGLDDVKEAHAGTIQASQTLAEILEAVALYAKAISCNLNLLIAATSGQPGEAIDTLRETHRHINSVFGEEAEFCSNMELMNRYRILRSAEIDPADTEAVQAYFDKVNKTLVFAPASTNN